MGSAVATHLQQRHYACQGAAPMCIPAQAAYRAAAASMLRAAHAPPDMLGVGEEMGHLLTFSWLKQGLVWDPPDSAA